MLTHLMAEPRRPGPFQTRALILAPTRELALQIDEAIRSLSAGARIRTVVIIGGASRFRQCEAMRRGAEIVIGTPGRVRDLMNTRELSIATAERFVLDEADRMLDLGFIRDIRHIVSALPSRRQSALFSATMPGEIASLAAGLLRDPVRVEIAREEATAPKIAQSVRFVSASGKQALLAELLREPAFKRVLVFTRTKHGANKVAERLEATGVQVDAIHGNKSQPQRERALRDFKTGRARVLVATDIAARGHRRDGRLARDQLRPAGRARELCPPHRPHRARRRRGHRDRVLRPGRAVDAASDRAVDGREDPGGGGDPA
jgi:ATP-dependent RNA helicase RhlE